MRKFTFRVASPFGGCGAGTRGFLDAEVTFPNVNASARFESVGGIDSDPLACKDFESLTDSPALCADVRTLETSDVRRALGTRAPDVVLFSPPCQGASGLLSAAKSKSPHYQQLNELALVWTRLMLGAWPEPPALVLLENVPRLPSRAAGMLAQVRALLRGAGYLLTEQSHDCGELGGLAQHRRRYLLVARHPARCPPVLYQPPKRRVRGCGEVLAALPVPGTEAARAWGPMHVMPRLTWRNWCRLALIPAGGDWRDLEGVLADGQARRARFRRHGVQDWSAPVGTIAGSGSNGVANVADPRVSTAFDAGYAVLDWRAAARTIAATSAVGCGAYAVADPRIAEAPPCAGLSTGEPDQRPPFLPVLISDDDTWHRPLTTLKLAALQGFPLHHAGRPLQLAGTSQSSWRERIGNAIPPPAARAIAEQMLVALAEGALGTFSLSSNPVWVAPGAMHSLQSQLEHHP